MATPTTLSTHYTTGSRSTRRRNGDRSILRRHWGRKLNVLGYRNQTSHRLDQRSLVQPIGGRRRRQSWRGGILPLIHLLGIRQLRSCLLTATAQPSFVGLNLSPEDSQLDLLVIDLEDGCQYSTRASRIASVTLARSSSILTRFADT